MFLRIQERSHTTLNTKFYIPKFFEGKIVDTVEGVLIDYGEIERIEIINALALIKTKPLQEIVIRIQEEA